MSDSAHVFQINRSNGGVPKGPVREVHIGRLGLTGDAVNHPKVHGGPDKAVCLFSLERILALQQEGHPIFPGSVGENLTVAGLDWDRLEAGVRLHIGEAVELEIVQATQPCNTIAESFADGYFRRIEHARHPGWSRFYARVLREGAVRLGDAVCLVEAAVTG